MQKILACLSMAMAMLAIACDGPGSSDDDYQPVPWEGDAVNTLNPDDDDDGPNPCTLSTGGCDDDSTDGGGNGNDTTPPQTPDSPTPPQNPQNPPTPVPDPDGWSQASIALEDEMLRLVNEFRASGGSCPSGSFTPKAALRMDANLRTAARLHSKDMADNNYFSHTGRDGSSPGARIGRAGYTAQATGENIAAGNQTALSTFNQWKNSDGHCRNMVSSNNNEIGIGYAQGPGQYGHYWTQTFGVR